MHENKLAFKKKTARRRKTASRSLQKNVGIAVRPSYDQDDSAKCYQSSFIFNARKQLQWQL
jgi:hypothetical protein